MLNPVKEPTAASNRKSYTRIGLFIDGRWIHDRVACGGVRNPSDEELLGPVPTASAADLEHALQAAERGFRLWRDTPVESRVQPDRGSAMAITGKRRRSLFNTASRCLREALGLRQRRPEAGPPRLRRPPAAV